MARPKQHCVALLAVCCLPVIASVAQAAPNAVPRSEAQRPALARLEIALVGDCGRDPLLFERIRSLFPPKTAVLRRGAPRIDERAVLLPQRADTLYLWVRVRGGTEARVYVAVSDDAGHARYLFRDVRLDAGLDEVGSETLAEVAHSSARVLWEREQQTSRPAVIAALQLESLPSQAPGPGPAPPALPSATPTAPAVMPTTATAPSPRSTATRTAAAKPATPTTPTLVVTAESPAPHQPSEAQAVFGDAPLLRLLIGASDTVHASGNEGSWHEPGGFLGLEYRARFSLRAAARYLVPTAFDLAPTRVELRGATTELRAGWLSSDAKRIRLRLEAGLGVFWGHAQGVIAEGDPPAHALEAQTFRRVYSSAALSLECPIGPAWVALGADLRVPLQPTSYEVAGQSGASRSSWLSPGGSFEIGIALDAIVR